ncbi:hypothetical protein GCM10009114_37420 [Aliiglaciecola litoralis]|uniref:Phospholipase_D-nuclease N-terminal n=1 Tax=Aliiglaciecola litoralis TaxID=582857 RepID=A0ABP3X730_9ALTE
MTTINFTDLAIFMLILAPCMGFICYFLGKRKTSNPIRTAIFGFFSGFIPPIGLIYLLILVFKHDLPSAQSNV